MSASSCQVLDDEQGFKMRGSITLLFPRKAMGDAEGFLPVLVLKVHLQPRWSWLRRFQECTNRGSLDDL